MDPRHCLRLPRRWGRGCVWLSFILLCLAMVYLICLQLGLVLHLGPRAGRGLSISMATVFRGIQTSHMGNRTLEILPAGSSSRNVGSAPRAPPWGSFLSSSRSFWQRLVEVLIGTRRHRRASQSSLPAQPLPWPVWQKELSSQVLGPRLQQVFRNYQAMNKYHVPPDVGTRQGVRRLTGVELLCHLKARVDVTTLVGDEGPFAAPEWTGVLPQRSLAEDLGPLERCAVVSSAGSMLGSGLGKEIGECTSSNGGGFTCGGL